MDPTVVGHRLEQALDGLLQPDGIPVHQQMGQERVLGLHVQRLERVGVGGVAGAGPPGLRHPELLEQHHLQLLRRAQIDLLAEHLERVAGRLIDLRAELGLQRLEVVDVDRDTGLLHPGEGAQQRQLHAVEQAGAVPLLDLHVQRVGQVDHRTGPHHRRLGRHLGTRVVVTEVQRQLIGVGELGSALDLQLTLEIPDGQIGQIEGPLVGSGEVGGQLGVGGQAVQVPAPRPDRQQRTLRVVHRLVSGRVGQPGGERLVLHRVQLRDRDVRGRPVPGGQGERDDVTRSRAPVPDDVQAGPLTRRVLGQPRLELSGLRISRRDRSHPRS